MILVKIPKFLRKYYTARATAIWPFVFYKWEKDRHDRFLLNHEKIHLQQQKELLFVFFYIWYLIEFLKQRFKGKRGKHARFNITFEKECYYNQKDLDYLCYRPTWNFIKYIKYPPHL